MHYASVQVLMLIDLVCSLTNRPLSTLDGIFSPISRMQQHILMKLITITYKVMNLKVKLTDNIFQKCNFLVEFNGLPSNTICLIIITIENQQSMAKKWLIELDELISHGYGICAVLNVVLTK